MKSHLIRTLVFICSFIFFYSCDLGFQEAGQNPDSMSRLIIRLTDAPGDYQEVIVELVGLKVHSLEEGWIDMEQFQSGTYDLLELQNGVEAILVDEPFPSGSITEFRLLLGENNTIKVDDEVLPLRTPGAQQSGLKIKVQAIIEGGEEYSILLDFDAEKSVHMAGRSGSYMLKPVIKAIMPDGTEFLNDDDDDDNDD